MFREGGREGGKEGGGQVSDGPSSVFPSSNRLKTSVWDKLMAVQGSTNP